jgi:hypothetical protein
MDLKLSEEETASLLRENPTTLSGCWNREVRDIKGTALG